MREISSQDVRFQPSSWLITLRWYYAPLALLFGYVAQEDTGLFNSTGVLVLLFVVVYVINLFLFLTLRKMASLVYSPQHLRLINVGQIGLDLFFFFVILLTTGGGAESLGHLFFIFPIIVSMLFFGLYGVMTVAVLSGLLVVFSVLLNVNAPMILGVVSVSPFFTPRLCFALFLSGTICLFYLAVGFFAVFVLKLVRDHDAKLLGEITDMVHQLRTPLSGVKWTLKILLDEDDGKHSETDRELLVRGFAANERMITMVNDVLAITRFETGVFKYQFAPVQFETLIRETIASLTSAAQAKDVHLEFIVPKNQLPKWNIDSEKIRDVLQNLLDNAIKYVKNGGEVSISAEVNDKTLHVIVKDNGIGIPDEAKNRIFTRFFRAQNAVASETNGSGLGLFITQNIVTAHIGQVYH